MDLIIAAVIIKNYLNTFATNEGQALRRNITIFIRLTYCLNIYECRNHNYQDETFFYTNGIAEQKLYFNTMINPKDREVKKNMMAMQETDSIRILFFTLYVPLDTIFSHISKKYDTYCNMIF